ncbi:MAG: hypothetical protein IPM51_06360 [Sphingobacteriaceae bacterium]|nr:hypothetical protein [Sphingobacteriaceae bacterium]
MNKRLILLVFTLILLACKKNQLGGTSTIEGKVVHHSKEIPGARVFIKFNTADFPGNDTTKYDEKVIADSNGNYSIKCFKGEYYLYGVGNDYAISPPLVVGGLSVKIRKNESVKANIAVTED